jgi:uncharacterized protein
MPQQVAATAVLLAEGGTVPFIARYRKERTGSLDEVAVTSIRDRLAQLAELDARRQTILKTIDEQGKLTDELKEQILGAETMTVLEDLYLPYKPKKRTRATVAREKGLEPLAALILQQRPEVVPEQEAEAYINEDKGVTSTHEALAGARDIIAEWISEDATARARMRAFFQDKGRYECKVIKDKEVEGSKYQNYFDWSEPVKSTPSHRVLAMRRGEKEGFLRLRILVDEPEALRILETLFITGDNASSAQITEALTDGYKRLLGPSMETEVRLDSKQHADTEAIRVFAENLRQLLLAPPLGQKRVLAIDPGFRTGCKVVCLDAQGKLLYDDVIKTAVQTYEIEAIAIGNGTASRETEAFVRRIPLEPKISVIMVNESGASVYSASPVAREEFPDKDVTVRGAVSIGRRLMDPLAELVKIDPKSIGVGQYQHDVDQPQLRQGLDDMVIHCVNSVGVELNTASKQLLTYISGLGPVLAQNIVTYRNENGPFRSRHDLLQVKRLGAKAFEQAAGFLRIRDSDNPLDASAVHPESYHVVDQMAKDAACSVIDLMGHASLREKIRLDRYVTDTVGLPTLQDIMAELARPGRDPRRQFEIFTFAEGVTSLEDLKQGMTLPGIVTNITRFGAFVDIGVHQDGLVHISEMSHDFVKDPADLIKVHQRVKVTVLGVDIERRRIMLSMKGEKSVQTIETPKRVPTERPKHKRKPRPKPVRRPQKETRIPRRDTDDRIGDRLNITLN